MSPTTLALALIIGIAVGAGGFYMAVPAIDSLSKQMMKIALKSEDAWILVQRASSYSLEPVEYDKAVNAYHTEADDDEVEWFEDDAGLMHSLWQTPFGVAFEDSSAVVDPVTAAVGAQEADKDTDDDKLTGGESFTLEDLQKQLHVGTHERQSEGFKHRIDIINPFVELDGVETTTETTTTTKTIDTDGSMITDGGSKSDNQDQDQDQDQDQEQSLSLLQRLGLRSVADDADVDEEPSVEELAAETKTEPVEARTIETTETKVEKQMDIIDVRQITSLLSHAGSPDTPRKTAENAAQAERAFENWGELKRNASLIAAFVIGAIMMYIGMSNGGGGGGGVSLMVDLALGVM
jgi:hypothetical protein